MKLPKCYLVNVGHGNATVVHDTEGVIVIDTGIRQRLLLFLLANEIKVIDTIIISHADHDHIAGIIDLLLSEEIAINRVFLNTDPSQGSAELVGIASALSEARRMHGTKVFTGVNNGISGFIKHGMVDIEVLSPDVAEGIHGITGTDGEGKRIDRHAMNAVVRLALGDRKLILLPGDLNEQGLKRIQSRGVGLTSEVLVFPHHGGTPGTADPAIFSTELCNLVEPNYVVFSVASEREHHPRTEVVESVAARSGTTILSTGVALPLTKVIDRTPGCAHVNGAGNISFSLKDDKIEPICTK